jgi:hypothetical protein
MNSSVSMGRWQGTCLSSVGRLAQVSIFDVCDPATADACGRCDIANSCFIGSYLSSLEVITRSAIGIVARPRQLPPNFAARVLIYGSGLAVRWEKHALLPGSFEDLAIDGRRRKRGRACGPNFSSDARRRVASCCRSLGRALEPLRARPLEAANSRCSSRSTARMLAGTCSRTRACRR